MKSNKSNSSHGGVSIINGVAVKNTSVNIN